MIARSIALFICLLLGTLSFLVVAKADRPEGTDNRKEAARSGGIKKIAGETGMASIYAYRGDKTSGSRTANGEKVRPTDMSAAHKSIPFGTKVRVTNLVNGLTAVVRINDRGPFIRGRIIDLTPAAAQALGFSAQREGLARVTLTVLND
jgi:rare lipoprotein A